MSTSTAFQTAVRAGVTHDRRLEAIETLVEREKTRNLATIVRTGGLRGEYRRRALEGLADCHATDHLEALADDTTVEPSLRRRAADLV
ncbi:hypothetical protein OB955_07790 [Halobacteria archaeon AArc-m2/3/4]|uniref:Uncharacterized protein n=1 Tax=Natronoglomus mannanivorans TaxID=2979990 RepID=A0AAP2YWQ7_9EURY|nr:hypothetical protein [Halobacteria archaeon AArc-xg1-1]MCU4972639.1 hypothetical protein [Halobacteria archaeon AArc-m2/3/4]